MSIVNSKIFSLVSVYTVCFRQTYLYNLKKCRKDKVILQKWNKLHHELNFQRNADCQIIQHHLTKVRAGGKSSVSGGVCACL